MHKFLSILLLAFFAFAPSTAFAQEKQKLPNILWITCEDIGPHVGCYGDDYAITPNIDRLAKKSLRYLHCWSNAPVCAPARTTIITGMYANSTGSHHMRSRTRLPEGIDMYPVLLRALGYYCTNRVKEDFNLIAPQNLWSEKASNKAHYKNRQPGQPFFAIFNFTICHESQIRNPIKKLLHDPQKVKLPAYHPDTPEVRRDWAQYYTRITQMDEQVGQVLRELEEAGLLEDTIIFFYSDHGSGMPRHKRFAGNSGFHVPFIVHVPERWRHLAPEDYRPGGTTDRLVEFADLAPTLLSIAGQRPPDYHQGEAFMGKYAAKPKPYIYGFRGRMDERPDMSRSVRDQRYVYIRNYLTHKPHGQHLMYQMQTPTTRVWKELFDMGKLNEAQSQFWKTPRAPEELYDLQNDPDEVRNLAGSPKQQDILQRFRKAHEEHVFKIRDVGFLPEPEIHTRSKGSTPYEMARDPKKFPLKRIFAMAQLASSGEQALPKLQKGLKDDDSAVRYWSVMGLRMRGKDVVQQNLEPLRQVLADPAPTVRIAAAETLGHYGTEKDVSASLRVLIELGDPRKNDVHQVVMALNVLDELGEKTRAVLPVINSWPENMPKGKSSDPRSNNGVERLLKRIKEELKTQ